LSLWHVLDAPVLGFDPIRPLSDVLALAALDAAIPAPGGAALFGVGLAALGLVRRRAAGRRQAAAAAGARNPPTGVGGIYILSRDYNSQRVSI
jgi:hypothetical protein